MKIRSLLVIHYCFVFIHLSGMETSKREIISQLSVGDYTFKRAELSDLTKLINLINTEAIKESQKIVILPQKFRKKKLKLAIKKNHLFIVQHKKEIVGFKKMYIITDDTEKSDMLSNEIRCIDNEINCSFSGHITPEGNFIQLNVPILGDHYQLCIYNGSDFTLENHRGKGLNKELTNFALSLMLDEIKKEIIERGIRYITMLYGITIKNAGEYPGAPTDRTMSIVKSLNLLIQKLEGNTGNFILHKRYHAFMPTFDPESDVLQPLSDEYSIPGFGCLLTYELGKSHE